MKQLAFIFPGQGSQYIGMGKDFYDNFKESRDVFEEASEALSMDLGELCFNGSEEELQKTENTQPAILATSISMLKVMEREGIYCEYTAGLSLGEYASIVLGKGLRFSDAIKVLRKRGRFMQEAVPFGVGGMAAILGLDDEKLSMVIETSKDHGIVEVANYNSPGQVVISGELKGLEIASQKALELGAKKVVRLPVSGPFHCSLLKVAGERLAEELSKYDIYDLDRKIVANVDAKIMEDKEEIVPKLVEQVSSSVLWQQSVELMIDRGVESFIEIGPGKSLTAFVKRIGKAMGKDIKALNVSDLKSFKETMKVLEGGTI